MVDSAANPILEVRDPKFIKTMQLSRATEIAGDSQVSSSDQSTEKVWALGADALFFQAGK